MTVEGFAIHRAAGRGHDVYILFRQGQEGAGQRLGLFPTPAAAWRGARRIRDKDAASVMVPAVHGTGPRLVRP